MSGALALFDFDGTITKRDSLMDFLIYHFGYVKFISGIAALSPSIIQYKMGLKSNHEAKEALIRHFFKGRKTSSVRKIAESYSRERLPCIIRAVAMQRITWHLSMKHRVVVVSASLDIWMKDWCNQHGLELLATRAEEDDGILTGGFLGSNCYGPEKVRRIREFIDLKDYSYIYSYGDSKGDMQMLEIADEKYYRWKKLA